MRVAVTGGAGFLGSHICDALADSGRDVVVVDVATSTWVPSDRAFIEADVRSRPDVQRALDGCDAVVHCAAVADLAASRRDPRQAIDVNVVGTLNVLEAAAGTGATRILHASSVYALSRHGSVYRTTKLAAERLVQDLSPELGLRPTILRFGSLYGPRADEQNAVRRMVEQAFRRQRIDFWGDGRELREYIHVRDAARLTVEALDDQYVGQALHITGSERVTTLAVMETIREILGGAVEISLSEDPLEDRYRNTPYAVDPSPGVRITPKTFVDLELGLLESLRALQEEA